MPNIKIPGFAWKHFKSLVI